MKLSALAGLSLLAVAACAPQPSPQAVSGTQPLKPGSYAAGSPSDTTSAFDGMYSGVAVQDIGQGGNVLTPGEAVNCPPYGPPPPLTIANGLAQFQLLGYTFQGYVTPQGRLKMNTGYGHTVEGQIDNRGVFTAHGVGKCTYNASWRRSS